MGGKDELPLDIDLSGQYVNRYGNIQAYSYNKPIVQNKGSKNSITKSSVYRIGQYSLNNSQFQNIPLLIQVLTIIAVNIILLMVEISLFRYTRAVELMIVNRYGQILDLVEMKKRSNVPPMIRKAMEIMKH